MAKILNWIDVQKTLRTKGIQIIPETVYAMTSATVRATREFQVRQTTSSVPAGSLSDKED